MIRALVLVADETAFLKVKVMNEKADRMRIRSTLYSQVLPE